MSTSAFMASAIGLVIRPNSSTTLPTSSGSTSATSSNNSTMYLKQLSTGSRYTCTSLILAEIGRFVLIIGIGPYIRKR